jgi:hypothetical protein
MEVTIARFPGLQTRRCLPCPCLGVDGCEEEYEYEVLLNLLEKRDTIMCHRSGRDVSLQKMLFGWGSGQQDRLLETIRTGFDRQQQNFDKILDQNRELIALGQRSHLVLYNALQASQDSHCPGVFSLRSLSQGKLPQLVTQKLELQLYCQEPGHWHRVEGGCYVFERPAQWLQPLLPYARKLLKLLRYAAPVAGLGGHAVAHNYGATVRAMDELLAATPLSEALDAASGPLPADGAALRQIRRLLDELDPAQHWGGLKKVYTAEGHFLWLCPEHAAKYRR